MTIVPPKFTIWDKLLKKLGKKRGMKIPKHSHPYDYIIAGKESFLRALFRSKNKELPDGMIDFIEIKKS